jgi:hypothetical protein
MSQLAAPYFNSLAACFGDNTSVFPASLSCSLYRARQHVPILLLAIIIIYWPQLLCFPLQLMEVIAKVHFSFKL